MDTLAIAKRELWEDMKAEGGDCQCCGRFAKLYKYTISKAQIAAFHWIVNRCGWKGWVDVQETAPKWLLRSNSHGKLVHWGLLESKPNSEAALHCSGIWRPTDFGLRFYNGDETVQKYALVFNNKCLGHDGEQKAYDDLYDKFHYQELMQETAA